MPYSTSFWAETLPKEAQSASLTTRVEIIFSLLMFFNVSLRNFLVEVFCSKRAEIRSRVARFMGYHTTAGDSLPQKFAPAELYELWHDRKHWPHVQEYLHEMIYPHAIDAVEEESNKLIKDASLQINLKSLTMTLIRQLLQPGMIAEKYQKLAPFIWSLFFRIASAPNRYPTRKAQKSGKGAGTRPEPEVCPEDSDWDDDPEADLDAPPKVPGDIKMDGFSRSPVNVSTRSLQHARLAKKTFIGRSSGNKHAYLCAKSSNKCITSSDRTFR